MIPERIRIDKLIGLISRTACLLAVFCLVLVSFSLASIAPTFAFTGERITDYTVLVEPKKDATVTITEAITFNVTGTTIQHGINRDIPIRYRNTYGTLLNIDPEIEEVSLDGRAEPFQEIYSGRYLRLRIGSASRYVSTGRHRYTIRYTVKKSIRFDEDFDEIYWNAIGTEWTFPIDQARVTVTLPDGAKIKQQAAYSGAYGASGRDFSIIGQSENSITYQTSRGLSTGQGLTVAVGWQKGIVEAPGTAEKVMEWIRDNSPLFILILFGFIELGWLYRSWTKVGRDPDKGVIYPRFEPSKDLSPAIASYVMGLGSFLKGSNNAFMAALVDLGIKGYLVIDDKDDKVNVARSQEPAKVEFKALPPGEKSLYENLLGEWSSACFADFTYQAMSFVMNAFSRAVDRESSQLYFRRNSNYLVPAFFLAIVGVLCYIFASATWAPPYNVPIIELFLGLGLFFIVFFIAKIFGIARSGSGGLLKSLGRGSPFLIIMFGMVMFVSQVGTSLVSEGLFSSINYIAALLIGVMIAALPLFHYWMKAPTKLGREVMDEVEGLKLYMTVTAEAQADQVAETASNEELPELTADLYEELLPYAMALGIEKHWSKLFEEKVFSQLPPEQAYRPTWYGGVHFYPGRPTRALENMTRSLSSDLSSAMTPPATSHSGSSGGGFSGGGGGGGGGSGW